jgi:hypothetical protein
MAAAKERRTHCIYSLVAVPTPSYTDQREGLERRVTIDRQSGCFGL